MDVNHEVKLLVRELKRLADGKKNADGNYVVKFGTLFNDDDCANMFEALVGTLRAAKRKKYITYKGEMLLQGAHDDVDIVLLVEEVE
ncbi:costars family protein ABRACL-like [Ylistrum balloti]|uniref:costars family protein ABRACL-like n=1 Tax=Ylistrum balloti TaxID=509963 RepID=UPI0029058945|nr:costars family protein ABRACL-like [Ylistrum balloti]